MQTSAYIVAGISAATAVIGGGVVEMIRPSSGFFGDVHWRGNNSDGKYALTFDDGPSDPSTARILDTLGELNVRAAFFVVGKNVRKNPKLIERMHVEGHIVANHSFDHPYFGMLRGPIYWRRQIDRTDRLIEEIIGARPKYFRPPMGVKSWFICGEARRAGHSVVTWSRRGVDGITTSAQKILDRFVTQTEAGDVLLMHDGIEPHSRRDPAGSVAAVGPLVVQLRSRGLEPGRLDELLHLPAYSESLVASSSASIVN